MNSDATGDVQVGANFRAAEIAFSRTLEHVVLYILEHFGTGNFAFQSTLEQCFILYSNTRIINTLLL